MSLFGAFAGSSSASSQSLFGQPQPAASQPSLFNQTQSAPSLFGAPAPQTPSSLFGQPAASAASLFSTPASASSLFATPGAVAAAAPPNSLFPSAVGASSASLFSSAFQSQPQLQLQQPQQQLQQQPQQQPQQQQHPFPQQGTVDIPGHTKITQLPEIYRTDLFAVERHLRDERTKYNTLLSTRHNFEDTNREIHTRSDMLTRTVVKLRAEIDSMLANAHSLRAAVATERSSAEPIVIAFDNLTKSSGHAAFIDSNGLRYGTLDSRLQRASHIPEEYFQRVVDQLESRAHAYKNEIDQIVTYLRAQGVSLGSATGGKPSSVQRNHGALLLDSISQRYGNLGIHGNTGGSDNQVEGNGKTIEEIIRRQYDYFMVVASHVANVNDDLKNLREVFLHALRTKGGDMLNPFEQADLREKADKDRMRIQAERNAADSQTTLAAPVAQQGNLGTMLPSGGGGVLTTGALSAGKEAPRLSLGDSFTVPVNSGIGDGGTSRRMSAGRRKR